MNKIHIWCPYCKKYQLIRPELGTKRWIVRGCHNWFQDGTGHHVRNMEHLYQILKSNTWSVNGRKNE